MVGDRLDADVAGAAAAGMDAAVVLTGATTEGGARAALDRAREGRDAAAEAGGAAAARGGLVAVAPTLASLLLS